MVYEFKENRNWNGSENIFHDFSKLPHGLLTDDEVEKFVKETSAFRALGLDGKTATVEDVKAAVHYLQFRYHPDKCKHVHAKLLFTALNEFAKRAKAAASLDANKMAHAQFEVPPTVVVDVFPEGTKRVKRICDG